MFYCFPVTGSFLCFFLSLFGAKYFQNPLGNTARGDRLPCSEAAPSSPEGESRTRPGLPFPPSSQLHAL